MKKIALSVLLLISLTSFVSADYSSGWKYITSLTYDYYGGTLTSVKIWGSTAPGGSGSLIAYIYDNDILTKPFLVKILSNLEKAKEDVQRTHITSSNVNPNNSSVPAINAGSRVTIDHEDN